MSHDHDDFATEALPGLPSLPPRGEEILWQGRPATLALARESLGLTWVAAYFIGLALWRALAVSSGTAASFLAVMLPYLLLGALTCGILLLIATVQARSTVYTITTSRVAMRVGTALTVTLNLPFTQIGSASLDLKRSGTGTVALQTIGEARLSYLVCWPHVRPWRMGKTQPALRCIPDAARVARLLAEAAETRLNTPVLTRAEPGMAIAAE